MEATMELNQSQSIYVLPSSIFKNTYIDVWKKFISDKKLNQRYKQCNKELLDFINECIQEGLISREEIDDLLFDALSFGKHKVVNVYNLEINKKYNEEQLLNCLRQSYEIENVDYNELARTYNVSANTVLNALAAVKILDKFSDGKIKRIRLIFVKKVEFVDGNSRTVRENSYFPLDIDFDNKELIVKYYDKDYLNGEYRGEYLANNYADIITHLLDIEYSYSGQTKYQRGLYNICNDILNSLINDTASGMINNIDEVVDKASDILIKDLTPNIDSEELYNIYHKGVFNINEQIRELIENICISKTIYESGDIKICSKAGLISHITYREPGSVRAVLGNKKKIDNLVDSQSYLKLRSILKETKYIEAIKMIWKMKLEDNKYKDISVKYDASKIHFISLKLYWKYSEEDLIYVKQRFFDFC